MADHDDSVRPADLAEIRRELADVRESLAEHTRSLAQLATSTATLAERVSGWQCRLDDQCALREARLAKIEKAVFNGGGGLVMRINTLDADVGSLQARAAKEDRDRDEARKTQQRLLYTVVSAVVIEGLLFLGGLLWIGARVALAGGATP